MSNTRNTGRLKHDEDCRYRRLYEGSQGSLNDMATKQAATLQRVATLRSGVLAAMKQHFPVQFETTERQLGHKLGTRGDHDATVLAFLNAFMRDGTRPAMPAPRAQAQAQGLGELRTALASAGIAVGAGTDLSEWAAAVSAARPPGPPAPATPTTVVHPEAPASPQAADDDLFWGPELAPPPPAAMDEPRPDVFSAAAAEPEAGAVTWDLANLFADVADEPTSQGHEDLDPEELFDKLYENAPEPEAAAPSVRAAQAPEVAVQGGPAPVLAEPVARVASKAEPAPAKVSGGARTQLSVVKPEMFPAPTLPRPARTKRATPVKVPRVSAAAPTKDSGDDAPTPAVATERFGELLAFVAAPRPVFMSDLVKESGSPGLVTAWEQHFQDQGTASPVRVITPRAHHRARGSLVVPHSEELRAALAVHGRNCWAECLDDGPDRPRLRGARLYEVAVLLHRYSAEVISHKLTSEVLSLRLNTAQGLTGVVMWVGSDSPAGEGRAALTGAVEEMIGDRMVMLAVLTHESSARAVERLAGVVAEEAEAHRWAPTMPVVASHSWDFASDAGASSLAIL